MALKNQVTKLKNQIQNQLHQVEITTLIQVAETLNIRVNPELRSRVFRNSDFQQPK